MLNKDRINQLVRAAVISARQNDVEYLEMTMMRDGTVVVTAAEKGNKDYEVWLDKSLVKSL